MVPAIETAMQASLILDGPKIERRRLASGMLKRDLAAAAGVHVNSVTSATNGRPAGVIVARKIAAALGASVRSLVAGFEQAGAA